MAHAYPRQPPVRPVVMSVPLAPTPDDQPSSQWPTFALTPAQRKYIRDSQRDDPPRWLLTAPLTTSAAPEVTLPARNDATGTLGGMATDAPTGARAPVRSIRMSGPQPGPVGATPRAPATPTQAPPSHARVATAQRPTTPPATQGPRRPPAARTAPGVSPPPIWSPAAPGQGAAQPMASTNSTPGQGVAWATVTLSTIALLICWLAVLVAPLGLVPLGLAIAGVIAGHIAQRRTAPATGERRLALTGVTLGYVGAIASVAFLVFAATHGAG